MTPYERGYIRGFVKRAQALQASTDNHAQLQREIAPGGELSWLTKVYPGVGSLTPRDLAAMSFLMPYFKSNYMGSLAGGVAGLMGMKSDEDMYRDTGSSRLDRVSGRPYAAADLGYYDTMYDPELFDSSKLQFTPEGTQALERAWSNYKSIPKVNPEDLSGVTMWKGTLADEINSSLARMPDAPPEDFYTYLDRVTGKTVSPKSARKGVSFTGLPSYPIKPLETDKSVAVRKPPASRRTTR